MRHTRKKTHKTQKTHKTHKTHKSKKRHFLFHPNNPDKSFDVYINKNPKNTIPIKYKTVDDVLKTIDQLENLYKAKKYPHKRIWQVGMIMKVRLQVLKNKKPTEYKLAKHYFEFLGKRTHLSNNERYELVFIPHID